MRITDHPARSAPALRGMTACAALLALPLLAGCSLSPKNYETTPVQVATAQGPVTCQLYKPDMVVWDRAIDRPESMTVAMADQICIAEGKRRAGR